MTNRKCDKFCVESIPTILFNEIDKVDKTEYRCPDSCVYNNDKIVVDFLGRRYILNNMNRAPEGIPLLTYLSREMSGSRWQIVIVDDVTRVNENLDHYPQMLGWLPLPMVH